MLGEPLLSRVQVVAPRVDRAGTVHANNLTDPGIQKDPTHGHASSAHTGDHHRQVADFATSQTTGVPQGSQSDHGGTVLVIVEHRNVQRLA